MTVIALGICVAICFGDDGNSALRLVEAIGRKGDPNFALGPHWRDDNGNLRQASDSIGAL